MPDQELVCRDCGAAFAFTEAEQAYFAAQGFAHAPKRCKACRAKARHRSPPPARDRAAKPDAAPAAPAPAPPAAAAPATEPAAPRPPRPRGPMHAATCSLCGTPTEVPFVPDGVRPVFCLPCLKKQTR